MSNKINEKLGLKPSGKRSMMKLPAGKELRNIVTSAQCPKCRERGARLSRTDPGMLWCSWCHESWPLPEPSA